MINYRLVGDVLQGAISISFRKVVHNRIVELLLSCCKKGKPKVFEYGCVVRRLVF